MDTATAVLPRVLEDARIHALPEAAYYIPNFITPAEESLILDRVRRKNPYGNDTHTTHTHTRLTMRTGGFRPPATLEAARPPTVTGLAGRAGRRRRAA